MCEREKLNALRRAIVDEARRRGPTDEKELYSVLSITIQQIIKKLKVWKFGGQM
jgi:hypothetical protein